MYIHVSAKYKSHKRRIKRIKKMPRLGQIVCIREGEEGAVVVQKRHLCDW